MQTCIYLYVVYVVLVMILFSFWGGDHSLNFGAVSDAIRCPVYQSKSTNLYMYIDEYLIHFIHVCQGFDKETFWHNRGVPKNKINLMAALKLSRELFLLGLFIEIKRHLFSGSTDFLWSALPSFRSVPLHPCSCQLSSHPCMYCMYECI